MSGLNNDITREAPGPPPQSRHCIVSLTVEVVRCDKSISPTKNTHHVQTESLTLLLSYPIAISESYITSKSCRTRSTYMYFKYLRYLRYYIQLDNRRTLPILHMSNLIINQSQRKKLEKRSIGKSGTRTKISELRTRIRTTLASAPLLRSSH